MYNVGSDASPYIHIAGLLPWDKILGSTVVTPGICMDKDVWGIRKLFIGEICDALDISDDMIQSTVNLKLHLSSEVIPAGLWKVDDVMFLGIDDNLENIKSNTSKRICFDTMAPPPIGLHQKSLLKSITTINNEQGAVKSDDAEVNTEIWLTHFFRRG